MPRKDYPVLLVGTKVAHVDSGVAGVIDSEPNTRMSNGGHPMYYVKWNGPFGKPVRGLCAYKNLRVIEALSEITVNVHDNCGTRTRLDPDGREYCPRCQVYNPYTHEMKETA